MTEFNPILENLSQLRLLGFKKAYQEQESNRDNYQDFSFAERLALLLEREKIERESRSIQLRMGRAKFREQVPLSSIRPDSKRGLDTVQLKELKTFRWLDDHRNLIITGASGAGKSWLAQALSHKACLMGHTVRYYRQTTLFSDLQEGRRLGNLPRLMKQLSNVQILIIDDFCLSALSEAEEKDLFELVDARHKEHSTILTSQNPVGTWHSLMPNPVIADAILDRLLHFGERVELMGDSLRGKEVDKTEKDQ